eukprot:NODE_2847_length_1029_cov_4.888776_g2385_i0.p4 GENE.NODE_2847_length_1029_cov_4.888776_g2385_i0~~NODE_2847_length_1029_cov_4.888776_g2385_i0.p4  ORF type:complete len:59 (-),score=1.90 NODE_2847_length_1029_cov_4.888776_g2385_i0:714-890(-)
MTLSGIKFSDFSPEMISSDHFWRKAGKLDRSGDPQAGSGPAWEALLGHTAARCEKCAP